MLRSPASSQLARVGHIDENQYLVYRTAIHFTGPRGFTVASVVRKMMWQVNGSRA